MRKTRCDNPIYLDQLEALEPVTFCFCIYLTVWLWNFFWAQSLQSRNVKSCISQRSKSSLIFTSHATYPKCKIQLRCVWKINALKIEQDRCHYQCYRCKTTPYIIAVIPIWGQFYLRWRFHENRIAIARQGSWIRNYTYYLCTTTLISW